MDSKVETIARLAQWRIDNFSSSTYKRSDPFKIGLWNWYYFSNLCPSSSSSSSSSSSYRQQKKYIFCIFNFVMKPISFLLIFVTIRHLSIEKNRYMYIRLFPEPSRLSKEQPPIARFVLRVTISGSNRKPCISPSTLLLLQLLLFCSTSVKKKKRDIAN